MTVEVTTTYTVEVHAEDKLGAYSKAWSLDTNQVEAQGSAEKDEITVTSELNDIEEIQRETEDES